MQHTDAVHLLTPALAGARGPQTWADLGAGSGTFTLALSELLPAGSHIHAVDRDEAALRRIARGRSRHPLTTHARDFTEVPWPFDGLDGVLMANSLHYVRDRAAFLARCRAHLKADHRIVVVEYDTERASRWVPYPAGRAILRRLFEGLGYASIDFVSTQPSVYREPMYAALIHGAAEMEAAG